MKHKIIIKIIPLALFVLLSIVSVGQHYNKSILYHNLNQSRKYILNKYSNYYLKTNEDKLLGFDSNDDSFFFRFDNENLCYCVTNISVNPKSISIRNEYQAITKNGWEKVEEHTNKSGTKYYCFKKRNRYMVFTDGGFIYALKLYYLKPDITKIDGIDAS